MEQTAFNICTMHDAVCEWEGASTLIFEAALGGVSCHVLGGLVSFSSVE